MLIIKSIQVKNKRRTVMNEAIDMAQNYPKWRLMSTFGVMNS